MGPTDLSDLLRAGSQSWLGSASLMLLGASALVFLFADRDDRKLRRAIAAICLAGALSFVAATLDARPLPVQSWSVLTIDRSNDYHWGSPGNLFDSDATRHMMRNPAAANMWSNAGSSPYGVGWVVRLPEPGRYELRVRYAATVSRPTEVQLDGATRFIALARTTGSSTKPAWFTEGTIELHAGNNHLRLFRMAPPPNIDAIQLRKLDATIPG
jgi:hypothetical protein